MTKIPLNRDLKGAGTNAYFSTSLSPVDRDVVSEGVVSKGRSRGLESDLESDSGCSYVKRGRMATPASLLYTGSEGCDEKLAH